MAHIIWDNNGYPASVFGASTAYITTKIKPFKQPPIIKENDDDEIIIDDYKIASWFDPGNDFPNVTAQTYLRKSSSLRGGIHRKVRINVGQGIYPVEVTGYDTNGKEIVTPHFDPKLHRFLNSFMVLNYLEQVHLNLLEYGIAFPQLIFNEAANYISIIKNHDSPFCRFTKKEAGIIKNCIISGKWPNVTSKSDYEVVKVLDLDGTEDEIYARAKLLKSFIYPIKMHTTGNIYYPYAVWDTARASGHLDISIKIAEYLMYMFDNQMSIKYHIQIPYSYWERKYPEEDYPGNKGKEDRKAKITEEIDAIETNMTTTENARKALITHYESDPSLKESEKWEIKVIDDKFTTDQYLPQAAASNAEILMALGMHPATMGISLSSGPYSDSGGGSDIREAFLVDVAMAWLDRQRGLAPLEMVIRTNYNVPDAFQLRTHSTVLTTLDTGSGTQKIIS